MCLHHDVMEKQSRRVSHIAAAFQVGVRSHCARRRDHLRLVSALVERHAIQRCVLVISFGLDESYLTDPQSVAQTCMTMCDVPSFIVTCTSAFATNLDRKTPSTARKPPKVLAQMTAHKPLLTLREHNHFSGPTKRSSRTRYRLLGGSSASGSPFAGCDSSVG